MKIEPLSLTVRQLCEGYADHAEDGVVAYGGGPTFYIERGGKLMRLYDRIVIRRRKCR